MELWMGLYLVSFLNMAFGSLYSIHLNKFSFNDAQIYCKLGGFLTQLESEAEIAEIQKAIWDKNNKTATSFWIGLKKNKGQCVDKKALLKGFRWTKDVENVPNLNIKWKEEPLGTCTDERCGLLSVEYSDSGTKIGGLRDAACKQKYPFICKRNFKVTCPSPSIHGTYDIIEPPNDPYTRHITCGSGAKFTLKCSNSLFWNVEGDKNSDVSQLCLQCKSGYRRDASGNCVDINECEPSNPCRHTCLNTDGSYKCVCLNNEDSDVCGESTTPTTNLQNNDVHPTDSDVNRDESDLIQSDGVSRNETAVEIEDQNGDISNIVVPLIIALLIFVVLLVIVAAIVKGCLRRRSVKLAQKKAETMALNGSNFMEKGNENKGHQSERDCKL